MWGDFQSGHTQNATGVRDTFVFGPHNGHDFIWDFTPNEPGIVGDIIEISGFRGPHALDSFADLNIQPVDTNQDGTNDSSQILFDNNNDVTVVGVLSLTADDFLFT